MPKPFYLQYLEFIYAMNRLPLKTIFCTGGALLAFAANSVLCRLALGEGAIDAAGFTAIRLLSGIAVLTLIVKISGYDNKTASKGSWSASFMLFLYAVTFSFAYISLDTGIGALILFGAVQITIILVSLVSGTKLYFSEWVGVFIAFSGFVYLVTPKLTSPSLIGFILMTIAGIAWGIYTLKGRSSTDPLSDTAYNFIRFILALIIFAFPDVILSQEGIFYAVLSGAFASGIGYAIWYVALGGLSATQAAILQLFVPVIAAIGGVVFASEMISPRLIVSSIMILGGILTVVMGRNYIGQVAKSKT